MPARITEHDADKPKQKAADLTDTQLNIPFKYKAMNSMGKILRGLNPSFLRLDEHSVSESAKQKTGLSDYGHPHYREGLLKLLESLEKDANLNPVGRFMAKHLITGYLVQRLQFTQSIKESPEIYDKPLIPPLIVTGLARSGTSFLHRMLAIDPNHRALPQWQLMRPFPENDADKSIPDQRLRDMERSIRFREPIVQGIDAIHFTRAETPEECIVALGLTFHSLIFPTLFPVPSYLNWYLEKEAAQKYEEYRWLLQYFQSEAPDRRLVLKTPAHTGNLQQIKQAMPQAMLIQTHRNPVTCVSSVCSLGYTFYRSASDRVDKQRIGTQTMDLYEHWFRRNMAFREKNPGVIYDVDYHALLADPIGTVRNIYAHFDIPWTEAYQKVLDDFIHNNPKNKHGKHHYAASDFGLDEGEIAAQFKFYSDYVGLSSN